jgi:hypothetical protein
MCSEKAKTYLEKTKTVFGKTKTKKSIREQARADNVLWQRSQDE